MSTITVSENAEISKGKIVTVEIPGVGIVSGKVLGKQNAQYVVSYSDDFGNRCANLVSRRQIMAVR